MLRSRGRHREGYNQEEYVPEGRTGSEAQPGDSQEAGVGLRLGVQGQRGCWEGYGQGVPGLVRTNVSEGAGGSLKQGRCRPRPSWGKFAGAVWRTETGETLRAGLVVAAGGGGRDG